MDISSISCITHWHAPTRNKFQVLELMGLATYDPDVCRIFTQPCNQKVAQSSMAYPLKPTGGGFAAPHQYVLSGHQAQWTLCQTLGYLGTLLTSQTHQKLLKSDNRRVNASVPPTTLQSGTEDLLHMLMWAIYFSGHGSPCRSHSIINLQMAYLAPCMDPLLRQQCLPLKKIKHYTGYTGCWQKYWTPCVHASLCDLVNLSPIAPCSYMRMLPSLLALHGFQRKAELCASQRSMHSLRGTKRTSLKSPLGRAMTCSSVHVDSHGPLWLTNSKLFHFINVCTATPLTPPRSVSCNVPCQVRLEVESDTNQHSS